MKSSTAACIFCIIALSRTEMAKGCDLPPQLHDSYQARCLESLPPQFTDSADKRVVTGDCGCSQLECTNPNTKEVRTYPLTREACGVLTLVDVESSKHYIVIIDVVSNCATVRHCVRAVNVAEIVVFALNGNGELCSTSVDSASIVTYLPVAEKPASYSPRSVTLTSSEYEKHVAVCSTPLAPEFSVTTVKTIVEDEEGYTMLRCTIPDTGAFTEYRLTLIDEVGLYTLVHKGVTYMVTIIKETLFITVQTVYVTYYRKQTIVYALNNRNNLCTASYDVTQSSVQLTQVTRSVSEKEEKVPRKKKSKNKSSSSSSSDSSSSCSCSS